MAIFLSVAQYSSQVIADMYKWEDKNGVVHFSDQKPAYVQPDLYELKSINTYVETQDLSTSASLANKVILYSTKLCGVCRRATAYFRKSNISFKEYDIEASPSARDQFNRHGGRGVPLILFGNTKMHGFSENRFQRLWQH